MIEWDLLAFKVIAIRTVVVYVALLIGVRVFGKRELGQMAPFDLVVILLLSNSVQNAMVGPDSSLTGGLLAATCLLLLNWAIGRVGLRSAMARRIFAGQPVLLVSRGEFVEAHVTREGLTHDQIMEAIREHGVEKVSDVDLAVLEIDGTISIVPSSADKMQRTKRRVRGHHATA
jgi:uncharacterized membrane protein YcaP (DUF421 family)